MMKLIPIFTFMAFIMTSICQSGVAVSLDSNDLHLQKFAKYNLTGHDNIDDEPHTHTHKHDENGEEHEHNHEHSKVTQSELKLLNDPLKIITKLIVVESNVGLREKNLISSPYPLKIYRPPIIF